MPRRLALSSLFLLPLFASAQPAAKHPFSLDDIAKLVRIGSPSISPDGQWTAYSVTTTDTKADHSVTRLWKVSWDGKQVVELTHDSESANAPRWSPDGKQLAFLSSRPGKAPGSQVWAIDAGGSLQQLTDVKQPILAYRWSPDGNQLLLTLEDHTGTREAAPDNKPQPIVITRYQYEDDHAGYLTDQRHHLYLFDLKTSKLTRLLHECDPDEEQDAEWSPDGHAIAFFSRRDQPQPDRTEDTDLYVTEAAAGSTPRRLTSFGGIEAGPPVWSRDSASIAFEQARKPGYSSYTQLQLAVLPATGGAERVLGASLDRPLGTPFFTPDGKALLTTVVDDRSVYVERVPLDGSTPTRIGDQKGVVDELASQADHSVVVWSADTTLPELYALEPDGTLRALTHHNDALLATVALAPSQDLAAKTKDGTEVHGLLTMPAGFHQGMKSPLLLYIHGGPSSQDAHEFNLSRQVFAAHGYAVLQVNYRGSNGRGHAYGEAIQADWGDKELTDLLAMIDAAIATGAVDPDKLVVGGWSYGGILTDNLITVTDRFKAASSGAGRGSLIGLYGVSEYVLQYDSELGQPWKNSALYMKLSYPFFHADRIHTPTLFLGGDRDFNVPLAGSEQMYEALRSAGTPTELVIYPGQHHVFTRPSFIRDRYQRWFDWYDTYLGLNGAHAQPEDAERCAPPSSSAGPESR